MSDWHRLDIAGLRAAYAGGQIDPVALVEHQLARIERFDGALRAFVEVDREHARAAAADSADRWRAGTPRALEGVPVAVKSNLAVAGLEWSAGMGVRRGVIARTDAAAVAALRDAGAIVLGTVNMHEAALGATTDNPFFGRTLNPHDAGRTPGGSSGGSGAAVAAGLCVATLGTDTMGSVRIPAAYNGIYGLKPTHGAVASDGLVPLGRSLDSIGPLARSLDDLETLLGVLTPALGEPDVPGRFLTLDAGLIERCERAVAAAYWAAAAHVGAIDRVALPHSPNGVQFAGFVSVARELAADLAGMPRDRLSPELNFMIDHAAKSDLDRATQTLAATAAALRAAIGSDGVLLTPAAPQVAFAHTDRPPANQAMFTALANVAGLPAVVLPAGADVDGMPVAIQLVGPPGSDVALLRLARRFDTGFPPSPILLT